MDPYLALSLADWADITIIAIGILAFALLLVVLALAVIIGLALRQLVILSKNLMQDNVKPAMDSARDTVMTVKGTTAFVSETTVTPIFRVYGVVAGARRAVSVIAGIRSGKDDA